MNRASNFWGRLGKVASKTSEAFEGTRVREKKRKQQVLFCKREKLTNEVRTTASLDGGPLLCAFGRWRGRIGSERGLLK